MTERERIIASLSPAEREVYRRLTGKEAFYPDDPGYIRPAEEVRYVTPEPVRPGRQPYPVECESTGQRWPCAKAAAAALGVSATTVKEACNGRRAPKGLFLRYVVRRRRRVTAPTA